MHLTDINKNAKKWETISMNGMAMDGRIANILRCSIVLFWDDDPFFLPFCPAFSFLLYFSRKP